MPPTTTTTTIPTTTTSAAEPVALLAGTGGGPGPRVVEVSASEAGGSPIGVLVSLGSAFLDLAVQALSYYLLAFMFPVLLVLLFAAKQRQEAIDAGEVLPIRPAE